MRTLVDDLLLLARLDERRELEPTPVDLAVLAADACSDAVAADPDRRITLDAPESVIVDGVQDHLRQAIANLVSNALTHTPAGTADRGFGPLDRRPCPGRQFAITAPGCQTKRCSTPSIASGAPTRRASGRRPVSDCRSWRPSPSRITAPPPPPITPMAARSSPLISESATSKLATSELRPPNGGRVSSSARGVSRRTPTPLGAAARDRGAAADGRPRPRPTTQPGEARRSRHAAARSRLRVA